MLPFVKYEFFSSSITLNEQWFRKQIQTELQNAWCFKPTLNQMKRSQRIQLQTQINCSGIEMELHRQSDGNWTKESWEFLACAASWRMPTTWIGVSWIRVGGRNAMRNSTIGEFFEYLQHVKRGEIVWNACLLSEMSFSCDLLGQGRKSG